MDDIEFRKTADYWKKQLRMMSENEFSDDSTELFNDIRDDVFAKLDDEQLLENEENTEDTESAEDTESDANEKQRAEEFFSEDEEVDEADKVNAYQLFVSEEDQNVDINDIENIDEEDDAEDDLFNKYFGED